MAEKASAQQKLVVFAGAVIFVVGVVFSWPSSTPSSAEQTPFLDLLSPACSLVAWGDGDLLEANPELQVWSNAVEAFAINHRAFERLGIPKAEVKQIAVGYTLNDSPVEMTMLVDGSFDADGLMASILDNKEVEAAEIAGMKAARLKNGFLVVSPSQGRIAVGTKGLLTKGLSNPQDGLSQELRSATAALPDATGYLVLRSKSFFAPGLSSAAMAMGFHNGLWVEAQLACIAKETCQRFERWLELHLLEDFAPGATPEPQKAQAFLTTVNLVMEETSGRLTAGSPPEQP